MQSILHQLLDTQAVHCTLYKVQAVVHCTLLGVQAVVCETMLLYSGLAGIPGIPGPYHLRWRAYARDGFRQRKCHSYGCEGVFFIRKVCTILVHIAPVMTLSTL